MAESKVWEQFKEQLDALQDLPLNFDPSKRHEYTRASGWNIDEYDADLPSEQPGPPEQHGSWRIAQQIVREYRFPPPRLITGIFYPDRPIEERVMLLRARFIGITFYFGARIGGVIDEIRETEDGNIHIWGYNYQTLEGHFEQGQIDFEVHKNERTGAVKFHIAAYSRVGHIPNIFYRIGFKIFGRPLQKYFAYESIRRIQRLVKEELTQGRSTSTEPAAPLKPASAEPAAQEALEEAQEQAEAAS